MVATPKGDQIGGISDILEVELTVDTSGAHQDGDLLSDVAEVSDAVRHNGGTAIVLEAVIIDTDDLGPALDLWLTDESGSWGTLNDTPAPSDAEAKGIQGRIQAGSGDYYDLGGAKVAHLKDLGIIIKAKSASKSIYLAAVSRDTPNYSNADAVTVKLKVLVD